MRSFSKCICTTNCRWTFFGRWRSKFLIWRPWKILCSVSFVASLGKFRGGAAQSWDWVFNFSHLGLSRYSRFLLLPLHCSSHGWLQGRAPWTRICKVFQVFAEQTCLYFSDQHNSDWMWILDSVSVRIILWQWRRKWEGSEDHWIALHIWAYSMEYQS